ncbi:MAG TPA: nucleotidyltransferase domain-containing protein [Opitutaceae bacterium]|nr:nucleotidyltransferase domain-containing protein [Opitutaceae bacterium]
MSVLNVLFPQVRAEVLRLLFADPGKELHLRELSRLSQLALGTLQAEVRKLASAELIIARRDGNRLYYRANTSHPVFPELQGLALKTTGLREQLVTALVGLAGVRLAFVFGSQAAGTAGAASDVDLLVVGSVGLRALAPRLRPVAEALGREINPHVLAPDTLSAKARSGDAFVTTVLAGPKLWITGDADELGTMV